MGCGAPQLQLPATPTYYQNSLLQPGIQQQSDISNQLVNGQIGPGAGADLSWLQSTINPQNGANALSAAQGLLQPQFRDTLQQINNQAANNNQLNSSTYTDALARSQSDLNSQYQSIVSQQAINDANQANTNKLGLFGTGLSLGQQAIGNEQQDTGAQNSFNLQNYNNQVAQAIQQQQNASNPGFFGNLLSSVSPIGHDIYSAAGYNVPGLGTTQTALSAASLFGGGTNPLTGSVGGNNPFASLGNLFNSQSGQSGLAGTQSIYGGPLGGYSAPGQSAYNGNVPTLQGLYG